MHCFIARRGHVMHCVSVSCILLLPFIEWQQQIADDKPAETSIRQLLASTELNWKDDLVELGDKAFPIYHKLLSNPDDIECVDISRILYVVSLINADRKPFLDAAVKLLTHQHVGVRVSALEFIAQNGSVHDIAQVNVLLSDPRIEPAYAAATALVAIGISRTIAAFDTWLRATEKNVDNVGAQRKHVIKCREELAARLATLKKVDELCTVSITAAPVGQVGSGGTPGRVTGR